MNSKIAIICGARPNFMKVAPLCKELKRKDLDYFLINTGQHFDKDMSSDFFNEFQTNPDYNFSPSKQSFSKQFSDIILGLEEVFLKENPSLVVVVGDVNSTLAGALVANKMGIKVAHIEAGLRSYNKKMPEENNRIMVDGISDILFATSDGAVKNLKKEGSEKNVYTVGNIMIDTLKMFLPSIKNTTDLFYFCTLHRAENLDSKETFIEILDALEVVSQDSKIYMSLHPRTKKTAEEYGLMNRLSSIFSLLNPVSYSESLFYQKNAKLVLTDSGGVQEESSYLGIPCITLRAETERPITVKMGTNTIGGVSKQSILRVYNKKRLEKTKVKIPLWDGMAAERIVKIIKNHGSYS